MSIRAVTNYTWSALQQTITGSMTIFHRFPASFF